MRAQIAVLFSPKDEEQLDRIMDGMCDIMRDEGFGAPASPDPDDKIECMVIVSPTPDVDDAEAFLESIVKNAYKVAIPTLDSNEDSEKEPEHMAQVIPIGIASERSEVKR